MIKEMRGEGLEEDEPPYHRGPNLLRERLQEQTVAFGQTGTQGWEENQMARSDCHYRRGKIHCVRS